MTPLSHILKTLPTGCEVLAVSKLQPNDKIRELYQQGQKHFGENYVQEALSKKEQLKDLSISWHFIGHLQKNKINSILGQFEYIHSIDSLQIAQALNKKMQDNLSQQQKQKVFLQINLANEESKGGFSEQEFERSLSELSQLTRLDICGLMTMPPLFENPEKSRPYFKRLREIRDQHKKYAPNLVHLSMGTSSDYRVAAEEGATFVRLGTLIFGERTRPT